MTQTFYVKKKRTLFRSKGWKFIGKNVKINETKEVNSKRRGNRHNPEVYGPKIEQYQKFLKDFSWIKWRVVRGKCCAVQ